MIKRIILCCGVLLWMESCIGPDIESLQFQSVNMGVPVPGVELGSIVLTGYVNDSEQLVAQGFLMSEDLSELEQNKGDTIETGQDFQDTLKGLSLDKLFYFKAWAAFKDKSVKGTRTVYSATSQFSFSVKLGVHSGTLVMNDTAILRGFITGLLSQGMSPSALEHGFIYADSPDAELSLSEVVSGGVDTIQLGSLSENGDFQSFVSKLKFNTIYYFKTWAITTNGEYYSEEIDSFSVKDGWAKIGGDSPYELTHGYGGVFEGGNVAYVLGCQLLKGECEYTTPQQYLWKCDPSIVNDQVEWSISNSKIPGARFNAVSFVIDDVLYIGTGQAKTTDGSLYLYDDFRKIQEANIDVNDFQLISPPSNFKRRAGAFAFVIGHKAYIGGGIGVDNSLNEIYLNDCWEYDPSMNQWQQVEPLPLMKNPTENVIYDMGRREALAFAFKGHNYGYVGGGVNGLQMLKDFWRFTPPTPQDTNGSWELFSFFPGPGRVDAVNFVIDNRGYFGTGYNFTEGLLNDFWQFEPENPNSPFTKVTSFPGTRREDAFGFAIDGMGYLGMGVSRQIINSNWTIVANHDMWRYIPQQ